MHQWREAEPKRVFDGLLVFGWLVLLGMIFGLSASGWLEGMSYDPRPRNVPVAPQWFSFQASTLAITLGTTIAIGLGGLLWRYRTQRQVTAQKELLYEYERVVDDWQDSFAAKVDATLESLLGRHAQRSEEFRRLTLFRTYRALRCVQRAIQENVDLFNEGNHSGDTLLSPGFFREAQAIGDEVTVINELQQQLVKASWAYELDLMDHQVLLGRCMEEFAAFKMQIPVDSFPNLVPFMKKASDTFIAELHQSMQLLIRGGQNGHWYVAGPLARGTGHPAVVGSKSLRTLESIYVVFLGNHPGPAVSRENP